MVCASMAALSESLMGYRPGLVERICQSAVMATEVVASSGRKERKKERNGHGVVHDVVLSARPQGLRL